MEDNGLLKPKETPILLDKDIKPKNRLKNILRSYVSPTSENSSQIFPGDQLNESKMSYFFTSSQQNLPNLKGLTVHHKQIIYASAETSKKILQTNKQIYERMMAKLKNIECANYSVAKNSCKKNKRKLDFFTNRVRPWLPEIRGNNNEANKIR